MFPQNEIDGFEKYWRRRKPGKSTALHYASDVRIFFKWANGYGPEDITAHVVDWYIDWQQSPGRAPATVRRRIISLRIFFDYYAHIARTKTWKTQSRLADTMLIVAKHCLVVWKILCWKNCLMRWVNTQEIEQSLL